MSDKKQTGRGFGGKGYYIALILCAAAIGISGYLYYQNANQDKTGLKDPSAAVAATNGTVKPTKPGSSVPKGETQPLEDTANSTTAPTVKSPLRTASPVSGQTVAAYAMDSLAYNETTRDWRVHNGIDIAAEAGTQVSAAADGTVYTVYEDDTMGTTVVIRHDDGYVTKYACLDTEVSVVPGDSVTLGQAIGTVGQTALLESALSPHVHFSVTHNDNLMDPAEFLALG